MRGEFSLINLTKTKTPELALLAGRQAFVSLRDDILGQDYDLSIVLVGEKKSQELNKKYRKKK